MSAGGDDNFTYSRVASNEPPLPAPLKTYEKHAEEAKSAPAKQPDEGETGDTSIEQADGQQSHHSESSFDSLATENQEFYAPARSSEVVQQSPEAQDQANKAKPSASASRKQSPNLSAAAAASFDQTERTKVPIRIHQMTGTLS